MKIYLVGFMGSGKTTIGRELAARIEAPFFDLDELIEAAEQMTIKELFAQRGEPYFRKRERDLLRSTKHLDAAVIATGGGTFTFDDNIQFIQSEGLSVFLSAPYALLRSRIGRKEDRPLFRDDISTHELYANRIRYYRMSDITIDVREEETPTEIVERLVLELPKNVLDAARRSTSVRTSGRRG
ncbi:MAG TPA: shikimate kinase [Thermoanaerobaculia bacterium]|nr:shikimate kinase [Thermoanaerobaculia bacterium]